jgi:DNA-binding SARP family transcriptional activator/pimeloyl-ACP methyl ester carboxylesterase
MESGWRVKFSVLGPLEIVDAPVPVRLGSAKQRRLLAALLVHANTVVSADRLVEILWATDPPADAAATLQNHVSRLRATLEPRKAIGAPGSLVLTRAPGYLLQVDEDQVDASRFERLVADGRVALREEDPGTATTRLAEALELWRGPALAEFADEPFARAEAARLEELRLDAFEDRIDAELVLGRHGEVVAHLEAGARQHSLREKLWARWMLALYRCGRQAEALRAYQELRVHLREELGITPSAELIALEEAILLQKPELDWTPAHPQVAADETSRRAEPRDRRGTAPIEMPKTRYAKAADGVHIAYQVIGDGPFDLVEVGGFVSHLECAWEGEEYAHYLRRLAGFARVITFDKRGTGMSDPVPAHELPSLERRMDDFRAVLDAVGSERAAVFGESDGGQMACLFAATYPERTRALITYGSYARLREAPDFPHGFSDDFLDAFATDMEATWGEIPEGSIWAVNATRDPRFREWLARWSRNAGSPGAAATMLRMAYEIDVREVLPAIRVPTLVLHRVDDPMVPVDQGRYFAAHIPGAEYVELPGDDRLVFAGDVDRLIDEIEEFLTGNRREANPDRILTTLLRIDIVDAEQRPSGEAGELRRDQVLNQTDAIVRSEVEHFRGRELAGMCDGYLAAFDGPARAAQCGLAVAEAAQRIGIQLRVGVHTGECERRGDQLGGVAVDIVGRVAAFAPPGMVLTSRTVPDLVAGSGLRFEDRGEQTLKGIPGHWQLFAVRRHA